MPSLVREPWGENNTPPDPILPYTKGQPLYMQCLFSHVEVRNLRGAAPGDLMVGAL